MLCCITTVLLGVWVNVACESINIQLTPQYPVIQGNVTLNVSGITDGILYYTWHKGSNSSPQNQILGYFPGYSIPVVPGPLNNFRITAFPSGSLQVSKLQSTDRGKYIIKIQTQKRALEGTLLLAIYDPVSKPAITVSNLQPQENDTITLTCTSSNAQRLIWSKVNGRLTSGAILSSDNGTVTFSRTNRLDTGNYQCEAENVASKKISDPYTLIISYGPENMKITGSTQVTAGSAISLVCVADSVPNPNYRWRISGSNSTLCHNHTLLIEEVTPLNEGNYTCEVKNLVTMHSSSASIFITVTESNLRAMVGFIGGTVAFVVIIIVIVVQCKKLSSAAKKKETEKKTCPKFKSQPNYDQSTRTNLVTVHEIEPETCYKITEEELYANVGNKEVFYTSNSLYLTS
ncbi:cell adhesion molecule CEACAM7-like isoform X2 [Pyxicephalus adspersus]|uniref:cell adhesion molecule CEACAM7-like isoform X2 n=1 Tax=Pyxicephalus adspersus TaxID=30357 RepID=UPI003B5C1241